MQIGYGEYTESMIARNHISLFGYVSFGGVTFLTFFIILNLKKPIIFLESV